MAGAEASHANCGHCGAPLPLSHGPIVVCHYCRREQRVAPPVPAPRPTATGTRSHASLVWSIVGTLLVVGLSLGFALVRMVTGNTVTGNTGALGSASGPMFWLDYPPFVVLGANMTAPLVVGMAYWANDAQLTALDGASGNVLWHVPSPSTYLYADGGDVLLGFDDGKNLSRFEPKTGVKRWHMTLVQNVNDISFGPNCASVVPQCCDTLNLNLQTGQPTACTPRIFTKKSLSRGYIADVEATLGALTFVGSVQLDDKPINPEPPRLVAQISSAGHLSWKVAPTGLEPVWTINGFDRSLALTSTGVFVFGRNSSDHAARWLLLDLASGRELYRQTSPLKVETPVQLTSSGALVFAEHDQRVEAYRVATGELLWSVGLRK